MRTEHRTYAYRPALDGVRALAVIAVLLFHGGVAWLPGGFLGVDAFFVLSGFLITSLLLAEWARDGRIRLGAFWLRRARRLLPALLAVLLFAVYAFRDVLPLPELALLRADALAALGYVANWRMIYRGEDYFAQTAAPSPLQHTWSLGIEEQFYGAWPLLVVAVLALAATKVHRALFALSVLGVAASAVTATALYDPVDITRAYFGTDARAQALLVGCAVAALLSRPRPGDAHEPGWLRDGVAVTGVAAFVGVGWLWTHADGDSAWLYRGGFTLGALAVGAVIAHAIISPDAAVGRILAVAPLVWLGKISYGLYLWHWPLFGLITADRTDLHGTALLAVRLTTTVAAAIASYMLLEQPIRTGVLPLRMRWPNRLTPPRWPIRRPSRPVVTGLSTSTAAIGVTAAFVLIATMPPLLPAVAAVASGQNSVTAQRNAGAGVAPVLRPNRKPGTEPRITFLGDSVSWTLGTYLPQYQDLTVTVRAVQGCGIARLPEIIQRGDGFTNYPGCTTWDARWRRAVNADDPDVAVILLDRWELMDRKLGEAYRHVGDPEYDAYLTLELDLAISIAGSRGATVVLLTAPYTRRAERPDGSLYGEDLPERVDAWNRLLRAAAARHPDQVKVIDLNARVCPEGTFTWSIERLRIRSDGLHFTPDGVRRWIAPWLMPQLAAVAVGAVDAIVRGD